MYAVYVRVSTDKDEQLSSIDNQADICRNWLERNGYEWDENAVYKDEGISGTLFAERPAIQSILKKAKQKEINMVIFKSISRLARDLKDSLEIREILIGHGVRIISVEEAYDSDKAGKNDMAFELFSMFAAQYSRTLSSSVSAAHAAKVRRGETPWIPAYGYQCDESHRIIIYEEEAAAVREVFRLYKSGIGYRSIAGILNDKGVKPRRAKYWTDSTVKQMLTNRIYTGDYVLNKYAKVKIGGRKKTIINPEEKWIIFEDHHPGIVSKELWDYCNKGIKKKGKAKAALWNELRGLLYCAECGDSMLFHNMGVRKGITDGRYKYVKCRAFRSGKSCVNHQPLKYHEIRQFLLERLSHKAEDIEINFINNVQVENEIRIEELENNLQKFKTQKKNLVKLQIEGLLELQEFAEMRIAIDRDIEKAEEQLFTLRQAEYVDVTAKTIRDAFEQLKDDNRDLAHVFQTLIKRVEIHQDKTINIVYTF